MENKNKQVFDELVLEGFKGVKKIMEYENLENVLTKDDIDKVAAAIGASMVNWVSFMKLATKGKNPFKS